LVGGDVLKGVCANGEELLEGVEYDEQRAVDRAN